MSNTRHRMRTVAILALVGTPSYVLCFLWHICMAGHMQHGPYPLYHWISDFWWMACFASVLVFSLRMNAKHRVLFLVGSILLIFSRIPFGSFGGGNVIIELPMLIAMDIYALWYLIRPGRYDRGGEQSAAPNGGPAMQLGNSGVTEGPPSVS
jgi:hypothetical protein